MTTWLHEERLAAVQQVICETGAESILDLGCGAGDLLLRLLDDTRITRITGLDTSAEALDRLYARLTRRGGDGRVDLILGSMTRPDPRLTGFDCVTMIETIEHLEPAKLSGLETNVFKIIRPGFAVITTPNAEFNQLLGVPSERFRHPDHRFEWSRARFRAWAEGLARRHAYRATCQDICGCHPDLGGASQMALFAREA